MGDGEMMCARRPRAYFFAPNHLNFHFVTGGGKGHKVNQSVLAANAVASKRDGFNF